MVRALIPGVNDLATLHPELAAEYSKENIQPLASIYAKSNKKYKWDGDCGHSYEASPNKRVSGRGCPYCAGRKILVGFNDFRTVAPELSEHFAEDSPYSATEITAKSTKQVKIVCPDCRDARAVQAYKLTSPYCRSCGLKNGKPKHSRTLAHKRPDIAAQISPNSPLEATDVSEFSMKKLVWGCEQGHEYNMAVHNRTFGGQGCPRCAYVDGSSRGERQVASFLEDKGFQIVRNDRTALEGLEIDIWLPALRIGIEYNGDYWHSSPEAKERDERKAKKASEMNIRLVVVWESDWKSNPQLAKERLESILLEGQSP